MFYFVRLLTYNKIFELFKYIYRRNFRNKYMNRPQDKMMKLIKKIFFFFNFIAKALDFEKFCHLVVLHSIIKKMYCKYKKLNINQVL